MTTGQWGWDSKGVIWVLADEGNFYVTDISGNESYYDEESGLYYLYDPLSMSLYYWDEYDS